MKTIFEIIFFFWSRQNSALRSTQATTTSIAFHLFLTLIKNICFKIESDSKQCKIRAHFLYRTQNTENNFISLIRIPKNFPPISRRES